MLKTPFAWIDGCPYLVLGFSLDDSDKSPSILKLLKQELKQHSSDELLLLRRLSDDEAATLRKAVEDVEIDEWSHLIGKIEE